MRQHRAVVVCKALEVGHAEPRQVLACDAHDAVRRQRVQQKVDLLGREPRREVDADEADDPAAGEHRALAAAVCAEQQPKRAVVARLQLAQPLALVDDLG